MFEIAPLLQPAEKLLPHTYCIHNRSVQVHALFPTRTQKMIFGIILLVVDMEAISNFLTLWNVFKTILYYCFRQACLPELVMMDDFWLNWKAHHNTVPSLTTVVYDL